MKITSVVITVTNQLKPILLKIFPKEMLSKMKRKYMNRDIDKLLKYDKKAFDSTKNPWGVNLIANIKADTGLGESSRIVASDLQNAEIPFTIYNFALPGQSGGRNDKFEKEISNTLPYAVNMIHINPNEMATSLKEIGFDKLDYHYNIGFWSWELEDFPLEWKGCIDVMDEIWTPSEFASNSIRKLTDKRVRTLPHYVSTEVDEKSDRAYFGLPEDKFLFLIVYNSGSVAERKNPQAAINAYKKAFGNGNDEIGLVIKVSNASETELQELKEELRNVKNVFFIVDNLKKIEVNSLIKNVNVYVSLHRAEGFGLVLAEAMQLGTAVISTAWSGNMEFMNENVACLVDYKLIPVTTEQGGFSQKSVWADADVGQAADYMKKLWKNPEYYSSLCEKAKTYIENRINAKKMSELVRSYYEEILAERGIK